VFDYTKGIPRRINQVCTTAFMVGLIEEKTAIEESTLRKAIAKLDHE
jgi:type II secretory pathway predicted ATPase ExeA